MFLLIEKRTQTEQAFEFVFMAIPFLVELNSK